MKKSIEQGIKKPKNLLLPKNMSIFALRNEGADAYSMHKMLLLSIFQ